MPKAVRAEEKDLPILTAQHTKLGKAIPPRADTYHFDTAGNFIAQFEQLRTDLQEFKKKEKLPLNSESIALYQKILRTIQSQALLSKNPYVLKVQNEAREIYANMQDLSSTFTKLKNELTGLKDALLKNPEVVSKSNQKQSDWKELPDCDEKKELVALLQEYEELKSAAKPYLEAHKRLQEFETRIKAAGYTATQRDLETLEQIKKLITNGPYLQPFQQAVTSVQTSLSQIQALANSLDAAHKIYTHLLQDASPNFHNVQESLAQIKRTIDGQPRIAHTEELRKRVESEIEKSQGVIKELVRAEKISLDLGPTFKSASKENATKAIELCRSSAQVEHPFVRAIVASCERYLNNPDSLIINELQKMAQTPDNYRSDLSLRFFTKQAGKASLYEQVQKARTTEDNRKLIDESMRKLFPEIVFKEAGFIEKCCKLWKSEEAPEFSQNELLLLETLAKTKGMPLQFALQFDLLKSMHEAKFHPRLKCPITHTTLIDLVATNDQPKHYYNGYAIRDWLATNPTSPMTRKPMTLHDVQANPQCSKLVHKWLMCKELMKPQPIEVANGPFAILSSCPEELKSIFKHYDRAGSIVWNRDHSPIRELLMSWARDGKSPLNAQWTSHLANTHMLAKSLIFDGFTPSSEAYEKRFLDYLQRAHTLVAYYDSLFLFIDRRLARDPNKKPFKDSIMLLRHILLQPDAFLEPAFTSTKEYLDRVIFGTNHLLYLLLDEIAKRGGNDPPNDIPPNVAVASLLPPVQWLYVATRIRSNLTKMQSVDDYHNYHQTLEKQCQETMSLRSFMERILLDAKAFIEMLVRYQHSFGHRLSASNTAAEIIREERQVGRQARMYG